MTNMRYLCINYDTNMVDRVAIGIEIVVAVLTTITSFHWCQCIFLCNFLCSDNFSQGRTDALETLKILASPILT